MLWTLAPAGVLGWTENAMVSKPNMRTHETILYARKTAYRFDPTLAGRLLRAATQEHNDEQGAIR